ncbi:CCT4 [Auxenochlorella protothecoides x Auxenochlorella symbiontica]
MAGTTAAAPAARKGEFLRENANKKDVRLMNIEAAKAVADAIRTSLGPRGADKMVAQADGHVIITNDGATILNKMTVEQPAAKMLVELAKSQDVVAGDGTTSVTVLAGALLKKSLELLERGVHPTIISDAFNLAVGRALGFLEAAALPVAAGDRDALVRAANTSLSSKVVHQYSSLLSPMAADCILAVSDPARPEATDLRDVRLVTKVGGTIDDSEMVDGLVLDQRAAKAASGPTRIENAKIALIQFQVSPPKSDIENNVIISDYAQMDRILKEERNYILQLVKKIRASGANVLLIQKSILRDAVTDLSLHYLAKAKIMVVKDIEREDIEFISKTLGCSPIAHVDHMRADKLASAGLVEEVPVGSGRVVKVTGIEARGATATVLLRGSNSLVLEEAERSLHDALCVVRCLVQKRFLIAGGGSPEIELAVKLGQWAKTLVGMESVCVRAFAEALEIIPGTLAENAGMNPIEVVTELRRLHAAGHQHHGINVRKGLVTDMLEEKVVQPLLVTSSALSLATECVRMILKIDDIVPVR